MKRIKRKKDIASINPEREMKGEMEKQQLREQLKALP